MLKTYCINLDHRTDRWEEATANYEAMGVPPGTVTRWSAVTEPNFGALGCAKSHVAALAHFLTQENTQCCMILEDDFDFVRPWGEFVESFNRMVAERIEWDALLLMGTGTIAHEPLATGFARIFEARSTAGYIVTRKYAAALLACFAETIPYMEQLRHFENRDFVGVRFAIDMAWQRLQRRDRWYIGAPSFGHQRPSFSDVEQRHVNYDALTYGLAEATAA